MREVSIGKILRQNTNLKVTTQSQIVLKVLMNSVVMSWKQKSLIQETIKAAGHLCLFLPKFHCELNPIEYFWGMVKKYLCDHCDYSFDGLKENLLKALDSVPIQTIHRWEHWLFHWVDMYQAGLGSVEAQFKVKQFSSKQYKSHRHIPENIATLFD